MMEAKQDEFGVCPYVTAQRVLAGKWSLLILHLLEAGPIRFNALQRRMPYLTQATLSRQLKAMEADGLVTRMEYPQIPPKVEYSLSPLGERFKPVLAELRAWGDACIMNIRLKKQEAKARGEK